MAKRRKLKLKVVFDTNVIYTGSASDLLRNEIVNLIASHNSLADIEIDWYIPETVIKERIFQMTKKGNELLPSIQKLEKLLGHNLNITKEIVENRIAETVNKQLSTQNIKVVKINTSKVDWESIIHNSLNRLVPFEDNEKEKGFRDALILESLKQIIEESPVTKSICRIAFITNDGALNKAANQIVSNASNIYIFANIDEFISLINILDSEIKEELIANIIEDSQKLFFTENDKNSLFYTLNLRDQILSDFSKELEEKPDGSIIRENATWWISKPGFEKKIKQQVFWKTIVTVNFATFKHVATESSNSIDNFPTVRPLSSGIGLGTGSDRQKSFFLSSSSYSRDTFLSREKIGEGKTRFEITWSITLTTDNKLKNPKIESIKFIDTTMS